MKYIEYDTEFTTTDNWQIYFGFQKHYTLKVKQEQWAFLCKDRSYSDFYKKLTLWTQKIDINNTVFYKVVTNDNN